MADPSIPQPVVPGVPPPGLDEVAAVAIVDLARDIDPDFPVTERLHDAVAEMAWAMARCLVAAAEAGRASR